MITLDAFLQAILGTQDAPASTSAVPSVEADPDDIMGEHGGITAAPVAGVRGSTVSAPRRTAADGCRRAAVAAANASGTASTAWSP